MAGKVKKKSGSFSRVFVSVVIKEVIYNLYLTRSGMGKIKIALDVDIDYDSLPIPAKIVIPIKEGKSGLLSYKQHDVDPLAVGKLVVQYAEKDRVKISVSLTGRLAVSNFPDLRLGGFKVEATSGLTMLDLKLRLLDPQITQLDAPSMPPPLDNLIRQLLKNFLLQKLAEALELDLKKTIENAMAQINRPTTFEMAAGKNVLAYEFKPNVESFAPQLTVSANGLHLDFDVTLAPAIVMVQPQMTHAALETIGPRRRTKPVRKKSKSRPRSR
jgi:hypothetical protein